MSFIMSFSYDSRPIQTLLNQIRNINKPEGVDLQPEYQRGYIWSNEDRKSTRLNSSHS